VVTIDPEGYVKITDRTKDLIKSGGEWISSVDLENALVGHPAVKEAAVVAVPHSKWVERPLAVVVVKEDARVTPEELRCFLAGKFAKWQLPDDFIFVPELPHTSTGKLLKSQLRKQFKDWPRLSVKAKDLSRRPLARLLSWASALRVPHTSFLRVGPSSRLAAYSNSVVIPRTLRILRGSTARGLAPPKRGRRGICFSVRVFLHCRSALDQLEQVDARL
jgi:hypothetical protein